MHNKSSAFAPPPSNWIYAKFASDQLALMHHLFDILEGRVSKIALVEALSRLSNRHGALFRQVACLYEEFSLCLEREEPADLKTVARHAHGLSKDSLDLMLTFLLTLLKAIYGFKTVQAFSCAKIVEHLESILNRAAFDPKQEGYFLRMDAGRFVLTSQCVEAQLAEVRCDDRTTGYSSRGLGA